MTYQYKKRNYTNYLYTHNGVNFDKCDFEGATHVITTLTYGYDAYLVFEKTIHDITKREDIGGKHIAHTDTMKCEKYLNENQTVQIAGELEVLVSGLASGLGVGVGGGVGITSKQEEKSFTEDIRIKYFGGDIDPPTTYEVKL